MNLFIGICLLLSILIQCKAGRFHEASKNMDYISALNYCRSKQMEMVKIPDFNTDICLFELARKKNLGKYWINGNDNAIEGKWVDSYNNRLNYTNWQKGEPNNYFNEDCITIAYVPGGFWNDVSCDNENSVICEAPNFGYTLKKMTFNAAVDFCKNKGMQLVRIPDKETNVAVYNLAKEKTLGRYWINGNDNDKKGRWVDTNKEPLLYTNWKNGKLNNQKTENCIESSNYSKGSWSGVSCNSNNSVICEETAFLHASKTMTYADAVKYCKDKGMELVKISDKATDMVVFDFSKENNLGKYWINGNDNAKEGRWVDTNNKPLVYTNWHDGEPNNIAIENCLTIAYHPGGFWNDVSCNNKNAVICEQNEHNRFHHSQQPMTFKSAVDYCKLKNMQLVRIPDNETQMAVSHYGLVNGVNIFWIDTENGRQINKMNYNKFDVTENSPQRSFVKYCSVGTQDSKGVWGRRYCDMYYTAICSWEDPCAN